LSGIYQGQTIGLMSLHALQASLAEKDFESIQHCADPHLKQGQSVSCLVNYSNPELAVLAILTFGDDLKPGVIQMMQRLKAMKIKTVMISGDHPVVAEVIAKRIGIEEVYAQVLPAEKAHLIQQLKSKNTNDCIAMVGDGVNDAPALAAADVGIAMSTGSDIAIHTAGITLMRGDPGLVPDAIEISKKTWKKIQQNLFWAFIYNLVGIPLAAMGYLSPMLAGAAMAASSVSVVGNALLLKKWSRTS
jgi:Cu+-exporting ATPase